MSKWMMLCGRQCSDRSMLLCTDTSIPADEIVHAYVEKDEVERHGGLEGAPLV